MPEQNSKAANERIISVAYSFPALIMRDDSWDLTLDDIRIEIKVSPWSLRAKAPSDRYYDLIFPPFAIAMLDAATVQRMLLAAMPEGQVSARLAIQTSCALGSGAVTVPVVVREHSRAGLLFVDGRHRSRALLDLGAGTIPAIVGHATRQRISEKR
jgi:hypothetical protein